MKKGFTLVEILVVIAIVGIIVSAGFVAFGNIQVKSRDTKRLADIKEIQNALENYYRFEGTYPTSLTSGTALIGSKTANTYLALVPTAPSIVDGTCGTSSATYVYRSDGNHFALDYCLSDNNQNVGPGEHCLTPQGEVNESCCTYYQKNEPLVMHFDGADNSTDFVNDACASSSDVSVDNQGSIVITQTGVKKFGDGSAYFAGDAKLLMHFTGDEFNFGTSSFTIDFWYKSEEDHSSSVSLLNAYSLNQDSKFECMTYHYGSYWETELTWSGLGEVDFDNNFINPTDGNWHHIAFIKNINKQYMDLYIDGYSKYVGGRNVPVNLVNLNGMAIGTSYAKNPFYLDELRITHGLIWDNTNCVTDGSARCFIPPSEAAF